MNEVELTKPRRRSLPRFSLRTLLILVLLAGSGFGLWWRWEPWVETATKRLNTTLTNVAKMSNDRRHILKVCLEELDTKSIRYSIRVMDSRTLRDQCVIPAPVESEKGTWPFGTISFSDDGRWVLWGTKESGMASHVVDADTNEALLPLKEDDKVLGVMTSKDSGALLVFREKGSLEVWSLHEKTRQCVFNAGPQEVVDVALSPGGQVVALTQKIAQPQPMVHSLITTSGNRTRFNEVTLWDGRSGTKLDTIEGAYVTEWGPLDDNVFMFYEEQKAQKFLYDISAKKVLMDIPPDWTLIGTAYGDRLVFTSGDGSSLLVCDRWSDQPVLTVKGRMLGHFRHLDLPGFLSSPNGIQSDFGDKIVTVWAEGFPERIGIMPDRPHRDGGGISRVGGIAEKPWNLSVCEWNLQTGKPNWVQVIEMDKYEYPDELEYSEDGCWVKLHFDGSMGGSPCNWVWKNEPGSPVNKMGGKTYFSPSGHHLLTQNEEKGNWVLFEPGSTSVLHDWAKPAEMRFLDDDTILASDFDEKGYDLSVWKRRRPEGDWGVAWLPEFWLTLVFGVGLLWSLWRDFKLMY